MALPPTPNPGMDSASILPLPALAPSPLRSSGYPSRPPHSAPATRTSFRESFTLRTSRFSLSPPTQPPSSVLPPRPDELGNTMRLSHHRRSTSSGSPINLPTIPASPSPFVVPVTPLNDPLQPSPLAPPAPTLSRPTSLIKRRLRMLSAPSPMPPPSNPLPNPPPSPAPSSINPYSLPPTPIGEPITTFQTDLNFMAIVPTPPQSPLSPVHPIVSPLLPPPPEQSPEIHGITSLSPPPRRGSRQMSVLRMELDSDEDEKQQLEFNLSSSVDSPVRKPLSLSPQPSVASLEDACT